MVLLGAALVGAQKVSARETVLIAGNADLYPIESYDSRSDSYVGLLPELYRRVSECTDYDLVYLPYSKNTTQAQQAENRQADIISAFPAGTVDSAYLRRSELFLLTARVRQAAEDLHRLYASALPEAQAEEITRALDGIGAAERLGILCRQREGRRRVALSHALARDARGAGRDDARRGGRAGRPCAQKGARS